MLRKVLPALLIVVAAAMANAEKISGFVKGAPMGSKFTVGSQKGEFTVDASKAKVTLKGKFFSVSKLTGGSQVTIDGTVKGKMISATSVTIGSLRGAPAKPTTKPPTKKPPMKPAGMKPPVKKGAKPTAKPGMKPTAKTMAKPAAKTAAKPAVKKTTPSAATPKAAH